MANMCDNHLTITALRIPSWFKRDPEYPYGMSPPGDDHFFFLHEDFDDLKWEQLPDGRHQIEFWFETKWAPPEDFYEALIKDKNIVEFKAWWCEPWCDVLGTATKAGVVHEDYPNRYYSEVLNLEVMKKEPPESYLFMEWDENYILLKDYRKAIREYIDALPKWSQGRGVKEDKARIERQEIKQYFST